jgi:hypothetical protein
MSFCMLSWRSASVKTTILGGGGRLGAISLGGRRGGSCWVYLPPTGGETVKKAAALPLSESMRLDGGGAWGVGERVREAGGVADRVTGRPRHRARRRRYGRWI